MHVNVPASFAVVPSRPSNDPRPLVRGQPFRIRRKTGDEKERGNAHKDRADAFEDEDPPPAAVARDALHVRDRARQQAAEGAGDEDGAPVDREALLRFFTPVPEADDVET